MNYSFLFKKEPLLNLLQENQLHLTKNRGQNFLIDFNIREKMISYIPYDIQNILEIGPGIGHFSYFLQQKVSNLIGIEIDLGFYSILKQYFPKQTWVHQDFLKSDITHLGLNLTSFSIAGNIPYFISTKICEHILSFKELPEYIFFTVEKDFAKNKIFDSNALLHKKLSYFFDLEYIMDISAGCFFPAPKKTSSFIRMTLKQQKQNYDNLYLRFLDILFAQPNKTIYNNLEKSDFYLHLVKNYKKADQLKKIRPTDLSNENLKKLFESSILL